MSAVIEIVENNTATAIVLEVSTIGPTGAQGPVGATGPSNILSVGTVTDGATAAATITGTSPAQVLNLVLPKGDKGDTGNTGATGTAATVAVGTVTTGAPGSSAAITNTGTSSAAVLDFAIPRGNTGATGATGSTGATGATGATGSAATVAVGTVTTGAAGSSAVITNAGTSSAAILDFAIPRGDQGIQGEAGLVGAQGVQGEKGDTGATGASATIAVGTVTTSAAGTPAVITNSGTSGAAVFDFTIPQGAAGTGTVNSVNGTGTVNGITLSGTVTTGGNLTLGGTLSNVSLATQVTGTLPVANGGTGATTRQDAMDALAGSVTSGQYLRGNGTDVVMSAIQAADVPTLNQNTTGTAANVTGTVAVGNGGTGSTTLTANNVLLGNGTSALQAVAPGTTGNVLTSDGTTWTSAPASGGVTSISGGTTGLTPSSATSGAVTLAGTLAVANGGTGATNNTNARTNLGATTLGSNLFTITNPSAITFPRFNANNTVSNLDAASFRSAIGAGTGSGTVTNVSGTGNVNGITLSGNFSTSGTVTLGGTLSGVNLTTQVTGTLPLANGGTGATTKAPAFNALSPITTTGDLIVGNGANSAIRLPIGTNAQVLTSNGTTATWATPAASGGSPATITTSGTVFGNTLYENAVLGSIGATALNFGEIDGTSSGNIASSVVLGGYATLRSATSCIGVVAAGYGALELATGPWTCTAVGEYALGATTGSGAYQTTAVGNSAGRNSNGQYGTYFGYYAGAFGVTGQYNTLIGVGAGGSSGITGENNTCLGNNTQPSSTTVSNQITLGDSNITTLRCQVTSITALSDARDKKDITPLQAGVDFVNKLNPVNFVWNMRDGGKVDIADAGFIAQELKQAQVNTGITIPNLVYEDNPNKLEASYGTLIPVLVKAIQELSAEVESLKLKIKEA